MGMRTKNWVRLVEILRSLADWLEQRTESNSTETICKSGSSESYRRIVNQRLLRLAEESGIEILKPINFVGIAESAARTSGVPNPSEAAFVLLDQIITRTPSTTQVHELNRDYARGTVLASLVHYLRDQKRYSLSRILDDSRVTQLLQLYRIKPSTVEGYFKGKAPNKVIDITRLWTPKGRTGAFSSYDPSKGSLEGYLKTVLRNAARDMKRAIDQESDVLSGALSFKQDPEDTSGIDPERTPELSVEPGVETDVRLTVERFRNSLRRKNPKFLDLLRLIRDEGLDPMKNHNIARIQRSLGMNTRIETEELILRFLKTLREEFDSRDLKESEPLTMGLLKFAVGFVGSNQTRMQSPLR
jgi:hypothetical protein